MTYFSACLELLYYVVVFGGLMVIACIGCLFGILYLVDKIRKV